MVDDGGSAENLPAAEVVTTVTREDLNEAIASLMTSITTEVKSLFKELLEGLKLSTDPLQVGNPTKSESDANSGKEGASSDKPTLPQGKNGTGIHAATAPPPDYGGPVPSPHINPLGPLLNLI